MSESTQKPIQEPDDFPDDISLDDEDIDLVGMEMDMGDVLAEYLASEDGVTIGDSLFQISQAVQLQNKILIKILNNLNKSN